jgi:tripartite-type tricarboxylate transporter receptor subunit TctC
MKKPKMMALSFLLLLSLALSSLATVSARAQAEPFFKGKTIRIAVGFTPGGFYDRWARLVARYFGRHVPGNPEVIVQNMSGASSVIAANYVYSVAKPDGLTMGMPSNTLYMDQLVGRKEVQFDVRKFNWIGTQDKRNMVLYMRTDAPYQSIGDVIQAKEPPKCGSGGTGSTDYLLARILEDTIGAKFQTVLGYPGGSEIDVAVERGEVICRGMSIDPYFGREPFISWRKKGFVRLLLQSGTRRDERASDVPTINELMDRYKTPDISRRVAKVILAGAEFGSPLFAPPGTPSDRVKVLRAAHAKSMSDPELLAEAKKGRLEMGPSTGEELEALTREIMDQPPEVIERVKKIMGN